MPTLIDLKLQMQKLPRIAENSCIKQLSSRIFNSTAKIFTNARLAQYSQVSLKIIVFYIFFLILINGKEFNSERLTWLFVVSLCTTWFQFVN